MRETHVCGDCGLSVQKMHRYHRDCIAALRTELAEAQQQRDALQRAVQRVEGWLDIHVSSLTNGEEATLRDAIALPASLPAAQEVHRE